MARKKKEPQAEGCPLWVVTFGDAMSLLVTFFVMLVSFADFEEHSLQNMMGALKGGLRAVPVPMATAVGRVEAEESPKIDPETPAESISTTGAGVSQDDLEEDPKNIIRSNSPDYYLHLLKNGVSLMIKQSAIFDAGTAELIPADHEVWDVATDLMRSVHNETRVCVTLPRGVMVREEGYSTAWGLGIEQSIAVQAMLARRSGILPERISASVRVVKSMARDEHMDGTVEILYIGSSYMKPDGMPRKILSEKWRGGRAPTEPEGEDDG